MLLTSAQILAAPDKQTVTVPVPEWGPGAEVLVGSMGALVSAEMKDWFRTIGHVPGGDEEAEVTCDAPDAEMSEGARIVLLEQMIHTLLVALEDQDLSDQDRAGLREQAQAVLDGDAEPPRVYTDTESMEAMVRYCAASILEPETKQTAFTMDQVRALGNKDQAALQRIYDAALGLNRATRQAARAFEKNSERTPSGSSGGATP